MGIFDNVLGASVLLEPAIATCALIAQGNHERWDGERSQQAPLAQPTGHSVANDTPHHALRQRHVNSLKSPVQLVALGADTSIRRICRNACTQGLSPSKLRAGCAID